jgi:GNAT superfamily N-acetyltransferase
MLEIRKATTSDASEVLEVRLCVTENAMSNARLKELGISVRSLTEMFETTHSCHCAVDERRMVGFAMGDLGNGSVFALFVRPEYEGKGLGQRLLSETVSALRRAGHQQLTLSTDPGTRAYAFYTRQGWIHSGQNEDGEAMFVLDG